MMVRWSCGHDGPLQVNDGMLAPAGGRELELDYPCKQCTLERVGQHNVSQEAAPAPKAAARWWTDEGGMAHIGAR